MSEVPVQAEQDADHARRPVPTIVRAARRVHHDFRYRLTPRQRSSLVAYLSFGATITLARGVTTLIRQGRGPLVRDVTVGSVHLHHYLPGIAMLATSGAIGVRGTDSVVVHCVLGAAYGTGCALVVDELPLLVELRDVYWTEEGRWAVELSLLVIAVGGAYLSGAPLWRGLREELRGRRLA